MASLHCAVCPWHAHVNPDAAATLLYADNRAAPTGHHAIINSDIMVVEFWNSQTYFPGPPMAEYPPGPQLVWAGEKFLHLPGAEEVGLSLPPLPPLTPENCSLGCNDVPRSSLTVSPWKLCRLFNSEADKKTGQSSRTWGGCSAVPSERWQNLGMGTPMMGQFKGWVKGCPWVWLEAGQHRVARLMHRKVFWDTLCSWRAAAAGRQQYGSSFATRPATGTTCLHRTGATCLGQDTHA